VVCGIDEPKLWFRPANAPGPVVQCQNCGFVYVNPIESLKALIQEGPVLAGEIHERVSANLNDLKGRWEEPIIAEYLRELPARQENAREVLARLEKYQSGRGRILDIGCFCGVFLGVAKERGWEPQGIEPLVGPAIYARGKFGVPVINDTLRPELFAPESFEVVSAFQVFEHLIHPEQEIEKIKPLLKPGGLLVVEVPNIATPLVSILRTRHRHFVQDHVSFFSAQTLSRLLESKGFRVREVYYPTRILTVRHLIWWLGKVGLPASKLQAALPTTLLERSIRFGLGDIVTVIASK
jgi:2-polyprenyl-3-methyl-5-hydroxy-6-metoxy-1,4-benzoquinol methylase